MNHQGLFKSTPNTGESAFLSRCLAIAFQEFVENHKRAINVGLKFTNVLLKVATNEVGLGDVIPAFKVKNYTRLTEFAKNLRAQVGEHDR